MKETETKVTEAAVEKKPKFQSFKATVNAARLNIRSKTDMTSSGNIIDVLTKGTTVTVTGEAGDWYKIKTESIDKGFCLKKYLTV